MLTEADLISLMDRHGIGTDATHAEHIETIKQRLYVGLEQNKFLVPGQLGMGLVEGLSMVFCRICLCCILRIKSSNVMKKGFSHVNS